MGAQIEAARRAAVDDRQQATEQLALSAAGTDPAQATVTGDGGGEVVTLSPKAEPPGIAPAVPMIDLCAG
jgi:hypothetical protein